MQIMKAVDGRDFQQPASEGFTYKRWDTLLGVGMAENLISNHFWGNRE